MSRSITKQEKLDWLRLCRSQNISRSTFFRLLDIFGSAKEALENVGEYSLKGGREKPIVLCSSEQAEKELNSCDKIGAKIIIHDDASYPKLLREIPDAPPILTIRGDETLLNKNILAIVGPRNASINGCKFARKIAGELGEHGFVVASGLARGIDTAAHLGSIDKGTIAVIAGGIDNIYPKENEALYRDIVQKGVLVSETPFGMPPFGGSFPQRNRIISGVSLGVVVVEATLRSGTLITARFAVEQNREVFSVPGSPFDPRCQGTNRLIKQGAILTENVEDILNELTMIEKPEETMKLMEPEQNKFGGFSVKLPNEDDVDKARNLILSKIGYEPISADEIIAELQIPARIVNVALVQLELSDKIENRNGKICLKA
ncbi:MAG: dprA [Rickettsiaceae bacterium]|jgi:DNA processing protein|nr:dprA [Rickettsiaceae bacterium]